MTVNASALNWYIRESVFDHINPEAVAELLSYDESGDGKLKQLLDQRAAQQFRLDGLVDDYASGLLDQWRDRTSGYPQTPDGITYV